MRKIERDKMKIINLSGLLLSKEGRLLMIGFMAIIITFIVVGIIEMVSSEEISKKSLDKIISDSKSESLKK